ncbi:MAG: hypothetical protein AAGC96_17275 [Pseudomonadota bacterium]
MTPTGLPHALGAACLTAIVAYAAWLIPTPSAAESQLTGVLYGEANGDRYPMPNASLQFCVPSGGCVDTSTGADGSYSIRINEGARYMIIAPSGDGGFFSEDIYIRHGMDKLDIFAD